MFGLKSFLIGAGETTDSQNAWMVLYFSMALNKGSSILVKLLSFGSYSRILRDLVISLKCLLNISATLLSSDIMSFCFISISFFGLFYRFIREERSDSFQNLFLFTLAACVLLKQSLSALFLKVADSCWIFSTKWSDTFRSFLYMERSKNLEKIYIL